MCGTGRVRSEKIQEDMIPQQWEMGCPDYTEGYQEIIWNQV